jgi:anti-sigma B factor antagonist
LITETKVNHIAEDLTIFEISGRLSLGNLLLSVESSIRGIIDSGVRKLVIDMTHLDVIDSSGIGVLVSCAGHMHQMGGRLRLAGIHGMVARVFETIHLNRIIPLDADVAAACAAFQT